MSQNFYIGQDIVCIKSHSEGFVKEGDCFVVKGLKSSVCSCGYHLIDIGIVKQHIYCHCCICRAEVIISGNVLWIDERLFAPLDMLTDLTEIEEILRIPAFEFLSNYTIKT